MNRIRSRLNTLHVDYFQETYRLMRPQKRVQRMWELVQCMRYVVQSLQIPIAKCCKVLVRQLWKMFCRDVLQHFVYSQEYYARFVKVVRWITAVYACILLNVSHVIVQHFTIIVRFISFHLPCSATCVYILCISTSVLNHNRTIDAAAPIPPCCLLGLYIPQMCK